MISADAALEIVLSHARRLPRLREPLTKASGAVLARDVGADRDLPPFDRAAVDGFAVRLAGDWNEEGTSFRLRGMVAAGQSFRGRLRPGDAVQVMTGAPVPTDADGVVMVEQSTREGDQVILRGPFDTTVRPGLAPRGQDARRGDAIVMAGTRIGPAQVAVLASAGMIEPTVWKRPSVLLVTTGDEIVEPHEKPRATQIRNSNGPFLQAMLAGSGWVSRVAVRRAQDRLSSLRRSLSTVGESTPDVLVFTGGVSMGEFDLVPDVLREVGFDLHFHRIAIRPGKPLLFGTRAIGRRRQAVFGLPGNPVSVAVTAWEFLLPYLRSQSGARDAGPLSVVARVDRAIARKPGFTHFIPGRIDAALSGRETGSRRESQEDREPGVTVVSYHGSGDFVALGGADCLIRLESEDPRVEAGDRVTVHPLFRERSWIEPWPEVSRRTREARG
ncbi:MAG: molybdopterin molybdotransferase MoeA [Candidatus Eisenbacteria bacterium]|uniref:Molybdopterin molybdenumtransferase n=1 Tax=Eiseniibacteriota bacterium TaxID=2212470 RepID=A0A956RND0_UNCEI|nr:molybdopterin molybdotransferase MoeA [Candidatus Eisenbacteria bacterium]